MPRQLRARKSAINYADLENGGNGAGPSRLSAVEDIESGSDFAPDAVEAAVEEADSDNPENDPGAPANEMDDEEEEEERPAKAKVTKARAVKAKSKTSDRLIKPLPARSLSGLNGTSKRQQYALPTPRVHQRHRAIPLFSRKGRVERLIGPPKLFTEPQVTFTNNFTHSQTLVNRLSKAWAHNVGAGPVWHVIEDRAWYKEGAADLENEATRRPLVYSNIRVKSDLQILDLDAAAPYLPTADVTTDEGHLQPPPPLICSFGPVDSQTRISMPMFEGRKMSEFFPGSEAHVFNAGAPVWGLDWCPIHIRDRKERSNKQYLAVAPYPSSSYSPEIGVRTPRPANACIQIWSLSSDPYAQGSGSMKCEMIVCHDSGAAHEIKWCPLPSHDSWKKSHESNIRKLGLLGGTFHDGSFSLYAIPDPQDVRPAGYEPSDPVFVKLPEPLLRIELAETVCWSFDWANSELIAIGTTHGMSSYVCPDNSLICIGIIAVYHIGSALKAIDNSTPALISDLFPTHYVTVHQSAIRSLAWIRAPQSLPSGAPRFDADPTVIASGGYDGLEVVTDIRDGHGSIMNRTRDVINAVAYSVHGSGPVTIDHDNIVKSFSLSPMMLGRGHTLIEPMGPVWSLHCSDYHPQLAIGSADGTCLTTNLLRATRRSGPAPFFAHKIFQLDYSRSAKEYRMLDHFLPVEATSFAKQKAGTQKLSESSGAWSREVSVQRVAWNNGNGLSSVGLLASGTASGLCRIDNLWGRWVRDTVPYVSVEKMRLEDGDMDVIESDYSVDSS